MPKLRRTAWLLGPISEVTLTSRKLFAVALEMTDFISDAGSLRFAVFPM